jgi:O-antigen ligase
MILTRRSVDVAIVVLLFLVGGAVPFVSTIGPKNWLGAIAAAVVLWLAIRAAAGSAIHAQTLLVMLLVSALALPPLTGGRNGTELRVEDFVTVVAAAVFLLRDSRIRLTSLELGFAAIAACAAIALLGSSLSSASAGASAADLLFLPRLAQYALIALVARECATRGRVTLLAGASASVIFGLFAAVGIAQYVGFHTINTWLSVHYGDATLLQTGVSWRRAFGTVGNPNYFGFLSGVGAAVALSQVLARGGLRKSLGLAAPFLFVCTAGVFVSGSRGALIATAAMLLIVLLVEARTAETVIRAIAIIVPLVVILPTFVDLIRGLPVADRFFFLWKTNNGHAVLGLQERKAIWQQALAQIHGHWLFGIGPQKTTLVQWVDNDYLRVTREFGLITAVPFTLFLIAAAIVLVRRVYTAQVNPRAGGLLAALSIGLLVMGAAADVFYQVQVMDVLMLCAGMLIAELRSSPSTPQ